MNYRVAILRRAVKELARLPQNERLRIGRDDGGFFANEVSEAGCNATTGSRANQGRHNRRICSRHPESIFQSAKMKVE